jgi:hypothetical protein
MSESESNDFANGGDESEEGFTGSSSEDSPTKKQPMNVKAPKAKASAKPVKTPSAGKSTPKVAKVKKATDGTMSVKSSLKHDFSGSKLNLPPPKRVGLSKRDIVEKLHSIK